MASKKDITHLIKLLDDPDEEIYMMLEKEFLGMGIDVVPELEKAWDGSLNELVQTRLENIIHTAQFTDIKDQLNNWAENGYNDLLFGAFIIAKYQFPDLSYEEVEQKIEQIRHDAWLELTPNLTALEKVKIINHILFDIHKFSGNIANYYSPRNSYINQVLEMKKGNPISLSLVYSVISQRLGIPIYGVNLPKNFILAYADEVEGLHTYEGDENERILFYINPFNRGAVFGKREIDYYIKQQKLEPQKAFFIPCSNLEIIQRMLLNLIHSYEQQGYKEKIVELQELFKIIKTHQ